MSEDSKEGRKVIQLKDWQPRPSKLNDGKTSLPNMQKKDFLKMVDKSAEDLRNEDNKQKDVDSSWDKNAWWYIIGAMAAIFLWALIRWSQLPKSAKFLLGDLLCQAFFAAMLLMFFLRRKWVSKIIKDIKNLLS